MLRSIPLAIAFFLAAGCASTSRSELTIKHGIRCDSVALPRENLECGEINQGKLSSEEIANRIKNTYTVWDQGSHYLQLAFSSEGFFHFRKIMKPNFDTNVDDFPEDYPLVEASFGKFSVNEDGSIFFGKVVSSSCISYEGKELGSAAFMFKKDRNESNVVDVQLSESFQKRVTSILENGKLREIDRNFPLHVGLSYHNTSAYLKEPNRAHMIFGCYTKDGRHFKDFDTARVFSLLEIRP